MDGSKLVPKKETLSVKELTRRYLKMYCDRSTIHGARYLFDEDLYSIERFCWSGIVITSLIVTLACYLILAQRYSEQVLITIVETSQYPVFNVEFPAVAVCPQRRVRWHKFEQAKAKFLPPDASNETHDIFRDFVQRMEFLRFGSFSRFSQMDDVSLEKIDFINITQVAMFLSFSCEQILQNDCYWRKQKYSCCDIFVWEKTEAGGCLVFNSAISGPSRKKMKDDPLYPWRNAKSGEESGLVFRVEINSPDEGIFLMVKKSEQWTDVMYTLKANTDTVVVVSPQYTITDANARGVPPEKRGCIYDTETSHPLFKNIEGLKYVQRNCLNVCHEEHLLRYCNCTISMFFPWNDTLRECRPSDYRCIYKYQDVFSFDKRLFEDKYVKNIQGGGMLCPCLISCDALQYFVTITTLPIANQEKNATSIISVDVHYQSEVGLKYRTTSEFTYLEMIASFGGLVGLFLGASVISAIELFYHLTFGLVIYLKSNHFFDYIWKRLRSIWRPLRPQPTTTCASSIPPKRPAWHKASNRRRY